MQQAYKISDTNPIHLVRLIEFALLFSEANNSGYTALISGGMV